MQRNCARLPVPAAAQPEAAHKHSTALSSLRCSFPFRRRFQELLLTPYGAGWRGFAGSPNVYPGQSEYQQAVRDAASFTFLGTGRFLSTFTGKAVTAVNASGCGAVLLFDQIFNAAAAARQTRYDNMRRPHERAVETAEAAALLWMLRGARAAVVSTMPNTSYAATEAAAAIFKALAEGANLAVAVRAAGEKLAGYELEHVRSSFVHYGLPLMAGSAGGAGGAKAAAPAKKK